MHGGELEVGCFSRAGDFKTVIAQRLNGRERTACSLPLDIGFTLHTIIIHGNPSYMKLHLPERGNQDRQGSTHSTEAGDRSRAVG